LGAVRACGRPGTTTTMASRKDQKDAARQRRLAEERARAEQAARPRRFRMLGGVLVGAVVVIVAAIAISSGGGSSSTAATRPHSAAAVKEATTVTNLLAGIPQSGNVLGNPNAKVTVTEYGDLACPICKDFALSSENQLISNDVRSGKVKIVYKALETASGTANNSMFVPSQVAALAAGQQKRAWNYIELFYHEQGDETTSYMTNSYLSDLAAQIPGLNVSKWSSDLQSSTLTSQVNSDTQAAAAAGFDSTPTILVQGPKSQAQPIVGDPSSYSQLESVIQSVS
jgi:protein-disulfide isomerase